MNLIRKFRFTRDFFFFTTFGIIQSRMRFVELMSFYRFYATVIILSFLTMRLDAQEQQREGPLISFKNKPSFFINLDRTSSFVAGKAATTNELRLGLDFKKKVRLGLGIASLASDVVVPKNIVTESGTDSSLNAKLSLTYLTLSSEYTLYDSKRWQVTTPMVLGIGSAYFTYYEWKGDEILTKKLDEGGIVLLSPSVIATYRILRWFGISGGIGYRVMLKNNQRIGEEFNSPIYVIRLRIFMGEIYKSVFPRGITGKRSEPYSNEYWD